MRIWRSENPEKARAANVRSNLRKPKRLHLRWDSMIGKRFSRLTVLKHVGIVQGKHRWLCRCDCGNETKTPTITKLKSGYTRSCGCLGVEHCRKMGRRTRPPKREGEELKRYWRERGAIRRVQNKIEYRIRCRIWGALKSQNQRKSSKLIELLGIDIDGLRDHLSSLFTVGMSWSTYGYRGWHIDHIIPCASFNLSDPVQQKECFHYTNLQPLWWRDNISKGSRIL